MSKIIDVIQTFRDDPASYVKAAYGLTPDPWQVNVMNAVARGDRQVSVRSGHGVGKTAMLSWLAPWFICTRLDAKVMLTAPTSSQLHDALIPEMKKWIAEADPTFRSLFNVKQDRIEFVAAPEKNFISARTSRSEQPDALQGVHADHVLLIGDEASGIPDPVFEAAGGSMSSKNASMVLTGNPVRATGYFYDSHTRLADTWTTLKVSCVDSDRVDEAWVEEMALRYGDESNTYRVRVLGEFPRGDDDTVIPVDLIDSAINRDIQRDPMAEVYWGVDVARFGSDRSAICKRTNREVLEPVRLFGGFDTMEVTGFIKAEWDTTSRRPEAIFVDSIGIGAGVVDRLREMSLPVVGVNVAESPALKGQHQRLRDELWFKAKDWLASREVHLPKDATLQTELATPRFKHTSGGKLKVESKDELRKRGVRSPDAADAFVMTFAQDGAVGLHGRFRRKRGALRRLIPGIV